MRDQWYGDDRDLLKWGTLVHIARRDRLSMILQLALYRESDEWPLVNSSKGPVHIPSEVTRHFRNLDNVHRLAKTIGIKVEVFKAPFRNRGDYFEKVRRRIESLRGESLVVLLDPDTGLAPDVAGRQHVTAADVQQVFDVIKPGDVLACYQRASRQKDWRGDRRRAFTRALGVSSQDVEVFDSALARDMVLFATKKPYA